MSDLLKFHALLMRPDPTPAPLLRLHQAGPTIHGFSLDSMDREHFVSVFLMGLHMTYDWTARSFRKVYFAVPRALDGEVIQAINETLDAIKKKRSERRAMLLRAKLQNHPDADRSLQVLSEWGPLVVEAVKHLEMGSRVFSVATEPRLWVAYGFTKTSDAPEWLKNGLI